MHLDSLAKLICLISILINNIELTAQCPGNLYLPEQERVDSFQVWNPGCTSIEGDVEIFANVDNLLGISPITNISGNLLIRDAPNLTSLEGLQNLQSLDYLAIRDCPNLSDISALNSLQNVKGISLERSGIHEVPQFENISSNLDFMRFIELPHVEVLSIAENVTIMEYAQILRNESLKVVSDFNGYLGNAGTFRNLSIIGNNSLEEISGFDNYVEGDKLTIGQNPNLHSIPSFPSLGELQSGLTIELNPNLKTIAGFNELQFAGSLLFVSNGLEEISGFVKLEEVQYDANFYLMESLKSLPIFLQLIKCGGIGIVSTGLDVLRSFPALDSVGNILVIENANLMAIEGFDDLRIGSIGVRDNPLLTDCRAFCNYRERTESEFWGSFTNNAEGCNSLEQVDSLCIDTIAEIYVYDVVLNTVNGNHTIDELEGLSIDIYEDENKEIELTSDETGLVSIQLSRLDSNTTYRIEAYLGSSPVLTMKYDNITLEMLSQDTFRIEYPDRLLDTILSLQNQLTSKKAKAEYAGGSLSLDYNLKGYDTGTIEMPIIFFSEIVENHRQVVEGMKRMGLGLHMVNLYFEDGVLMSNGMSKAFVETTFGLLKLVKELFEMKTGFDNLSAGQLAEEQLEAVTSTINSLIKFLYSLSKKYYINPKLAALENSKDTKLMASAIKKVLVVSEASVFGKEGLVESTFVDVLYNAMAQQVVEDFYVAKATQSQVDALSTSHENIDNSFEELVSISNQARMITENANSAAIQIGDAYGGFIEDAGNFADIVDNAGLAIQIATLGTGSAFGLALRALAKGMKAGTVALNGFNFLSFAYRLSSLPNELNYITGQFELNPSFESGQYDEQFLNELITSLGFETMIVLLENIQLAYTSGMQVEAASKYMLLNEYYESVFLQNYDALYGVLSNMGSVAHFNGEPDDEFLKMEEEFRKIGAQKMTLDFNFIAHISDLENDTIEQLILDEIDTLIAYVDAFPNLINSFFQEYGTADFPPLLSITNLSYPDSFDTATFPAEITIRNLGPLSSEAFNIKLTANEHCSLNVLESQLENIVLATGEEHTLQVEITPIDNDRQYSVYLEFEDVRGIDESLIFVFEDQILAFDIESNITDLPNEKRVDLLYPNPSYGEFQVHSEVSDLVTEYEVYDLNGKLLQHGIISASSITLEGLPRGLYSILLKGKKESFIEKLVLH